MGIILAIAVPHPPLIVPAVGRGQEERIRATIDAYHAAARAVVNAQPDCLVVTSPHAPLFRDGFHVTTDEQLVGSMARFNAPYERLTAPCDVELAREVLRRAEEAGIPAVGSERYRDDMDHGTYVPLYFVREESRSSDAGLDANQGDDAARNAGKSSDTATTARSASKGLTGLFNRLARNDDTAIPEQENGDLPFPIVRIGLSGLSSETHRELGCIIAQAANALGRRVAFIASGDLSHKLLPEGPYGFAPEGPVFDEQIGEIFASGDLERLFEFDEDFCEAAAECGLRSFQIMAGALGELDFDCKLLSNEGPFGVGYGVAIIEPRGGVSDGDENDLDGESKADENESGLDGTNEAALKNDQETDASIAACASGEGVATDEVDPCIKLARLSVETFVKTGRAAKLPADVPDELLKQQAGAFVSLHEHGELRGCIGTIAATKSCVAEEILANGISACSRDPRFDPVCPDELDYLEYSVDVLGDAEPIASPSELDVKRYGVIVTKGWKRGLLLPNLDGVDTVDYQLEIAKRKAGISPFDDDVQLERFEVVRHTRGGAPRKTLR